MSGGKYNATDFDIRIDEVVKLNSPAWNYLSMHYMHKIIDGDMYYSSLYRLAYSLAYPSMVKFINNSTLIALRKKSYDIQYFERDEKSVIEGLVRSIVKLCIKDEKFKNKLIKTGDRFIYNNDYRDSYFGFRDNMYGKCLMCVRDRKYYNCDPDFINNITVDVEVIKSIRK